MATDPLRPSDIPLLLAGYFNGALDTAQLAALERWVSHAPENADAFARYAIEQRALEAALKRDRIGGLADLSVSEFDVDIVDIVDASELELVAPGVAPDTMSLVVDQALALRRQHEVEDEANKQLAAQQAEDARNRRFDLRRHAEPAPVSRAIVIPQAVVWLGLAAVLGIAATVAFQFNRPAPQTTTQTTTPPIVEQAPQRTRQWTPQSSPVFATLVRTLDAKWGDATSAWDGQGGLRQGRHTLAEGLVEIELTDGARVVLEAPVSFDLTGTNTMSLNSGRMVAHVPPSGYGFTVDTPTARIVDYGTEFGVHVDGQRQTRVHVFQGEVRAAAQLNGQVVGQPVPLNEREAAVIDTGGASITRIAFDAAAFEQRVVKRLDLVDIVAGGDGTGDASGRGIDYRNGQVVEQAAMAERDDPAWIIASAIPASRVPTRTMIDSIFVIDRRLGSAVLDSAGTVFDRFPRTPAGAAFTDYFGYGFVQAIADGNVVMPQRDRGHVDQPFATVGRPELDGRAVVLHGGGGFTIDLAQVARQHGGATPSRFAAHALSAEAVNQASKQTNDAATADLWVLVDGVPRFEARAIRTADGVIEIDIALKPGDRFLSLVVSDAGDSIAHDWLVLSQPTLEVGPPAGTD